MRSVELHGDIFSVYTRAVRMALDMKDVPYSIKFIDAFDPSHAERLRALHPFQRVPILRVDEFELYETQAILDYVNDSFDGPALRPDTAEATARMRQVMGIADSYLYWPLVRQAASQHLFYPLEGEPVDERVFKAGLAATPRGLDALETIAQEGLVLQPDQHGLADCHIWPMMDYALMVPQIAEMMDARPALAVWAEAMAARPVSVATKPDLEELRVDADG